MPALANQYTQHSKFPYWIPSLLSSLTSLLFSFLLLLASFQSLLPQSLFTRCSRAWIALLHSSNTFPKLQGEVQ